MRSGDDYFVGEGRIRHAWNLRIRDLIIDARTFDCGLWLSYKNHIREQWFILFVAWHYCFWFLCLVAYCAFCHSAIENR